MERGKHRRPILEEGPTIQLQLRRDCRDQNKTSQQTARTFVKLMMEGKVRAALRLISKSSSNDVLHLDSYSDPDNPTETVRETLLKKHPNQQSSIVTPTTPTNQPHPIFFDMIHRHLISSTALRTEGSAGPSGLDVAAWKRMCTSFMSTSTDLCETIAVTARRLCTYFVKPRSLSACVACRLVALEKYPGVRPIDIGETLRCIIGRAIVKAISVDIQAAAGPIQLCVGHQSGCEAAVLAMRQVFESMEDEAVLLVDASNAFNSLNRQAALHNIQHLCPPLFIGPEYGYYPNAMNTGLVVKEEKEIDAATLFKETGVSITLEGKRHLGAAIGKQIFIESYVQRKVSEWVGEIESLSSIATSQPHAAYTAFTHGLVGKGAYIARTIPNVEDLFKPLENIIRKRFLPSITGQNAFGDNERDLMALAT